MLIAYTQCVMLTQIWALYGSFVAAVLRVIDMFVFFNLHKYACASFIVNDVYDRCGFARNLSAPANRLYGDQNQTASVIFFFFLINKS